MDDLDAEPMSAGELKARLYQTFRERGLVESLKSQLRTKLVTELRQSAVLQQVKFGPTPSPPAHDGPSSLMLRASNSLVVDHLRRCGYDYSMAVFLPESGSAEDKVFTVPDLLDLMRITPDSKLYKKLSTELPRYDSKGFLWQLLTELSCSHGMDQRHVGVQADTHPAYQSSIERKLQSVDEAFSQQQEGDDIRHRHDIQEKLLKMRREMEARTRDEINREIMRFKESELKRVELEQREKARKEIASARREIEHIYQAKSEALREREQATMDRIHKHLELIEKETYAQRQSLLEELRVIKQREVDIRRESEVNSRAAKMEEEKRKAIEENLRIREAAVANIESTYEKRLREETKRFELDHEARLSKRLSELEQREAKIRAEQRGMSDERETMKTLQKQLEGKARHVQELEDLLKQTKSETASAVNRSELLNEKMRTMVDYPSLKEDNTILRRDLEHAKMRVAELSGDLKSEQSRHEELIKQLSERMSRPSPELLALKSELEQAREQLKHDKATMQHTETQWKARLQEEVEANKELRHRLSEQTNEMASLMRQLADLKLALRQTQTALNNNIYHPARRIHGLGADSNIHNASLPPAEDMYIDTSLHRTTIDPELLLAESGRYQPPLDDSMSSDDLSSQGDSMAVIEQTKARFRELEREAEHLEQNYQDLQHRMSGVGGLYRSPLPAGRGTPGGTPAGARLHPSQGLTQSGLPDHGTDQPVGGSRHHYRDVPMGSPSSSKYPRRQAAGQKQLEPVQSGAHSRKYTGGKSQSDPVETGAYELTGSLEEVFHDERDAGGHSMSDQRNTESLIPGKLPLSPLSSSSSSAVSKGLRESDLRGVGHGAGFNGVEISPEERRSEDEKRMRDGQSKDQIRMKEGEEERLQRDEKQRNEEERRRYQEEIREEERRKEEDWRREEEQKEDEGRRGEEEERRRGEEEQRRREEYERRGQEERRKREEHEQRTAVDEEERRRRMKEEEEEEQRAWEEKRRQKEEERRRKDLEAREREQRMLMELQKQEHGATATTPAATRGTDTDLLKDGVGHIEQDGQKEGGVEEENKEEKADEEGIKIDPVMQRYMLMVQKRKQEQETLPPAPEARPDSPSLSVKSDGTFSLGEMDREMDDPASGGNVSDKDDVFDDW